MSKSKIEWTNRTWNPVTGCTKVSQGCKNCYAERMYERFNGKGSFKNVQTHADRLNQPSTWKQPQMVFVNSMSDLFHEAVPFAFIDLVFASMAINNKHTFQILTKRPQRMLEWFNYKCNDWKHEGMRGDHRIRFQTYHQFGKEISHDKWQWPLPNVWLGVSVEDQKTADERIPLLMQTPAAVRFLSCEPLLGPVDLENVKTKPGIYKSLHIDWVIAGGESGPGARPMHPDWVRSLRDQCKPSKVAFFFKQWGEWAPVDEVDDTGDLIEYNEKGLLRNKPVQYLCLNHHGKTSTNANDVIGPDEKNCIVYRFGKHITGRMLEGKEHNEYPKYQQ